MDNIKVITIGEREYQLRKINAIKQFHLARKLAGLFAGMVGNNSNTDEERVNEFLAAISSMEDSKAEELLFLTLQGAYVKVPKTGGWTPLVNGNTLMFEDLNIVDLGKIAFEVIQFNLANFTQLQAAVPNTLTKVSMKG